VVDIQLFLVNTFTSKVFHGQAVAVCVLPDELNDELLHAISIENHLPETAFIRQEGEKWKIRWFNREGEIFTSGHGLLAAAFVIFNFLDNKEDEVEFENFFGITKVYREAEKIYFEYPKLSYELQEISVYILEHVEPKPQKVWHIGPDVLMFYEKSEDVERAHIERTFYKENLAGALILTAKAENADFYVRCFFPNQEYCEETATAAVYPRLAAFWVDKLNKQHLVAEQGLMRRSEIFCDFKSNRLQIGGYCCCFYQGQLLF
jgi:PhzF family phenazine biosynthesis protein